MGEFMSFVMMLFCIIGMITSGAWVCRTVDATMAWRSRVNRAVKKVEDWDEQERKG